jgi:lysozyme
VDPTLTIAAREMLRRNEGVRHYVYLDSLGIPTVGVGFNLRRTDSHVRLALVGANMDRLLAGEPLSEEQIDKLLQLDINDALDDMPRLCPNFESMPVDAQLVLIDMRFNLGPGRLRAFHRTLRAFRAGRFADAADFIAGTPYAKQVGVRALRNCAALRKLGNGASRG